MAHDTAVPGTRRPYFLHAAGQLRWPVALRDFPISSVRMTSMAGKAAPPSSSPCTSSFAWLSVALRPALAVGEIERSAHPLGQLLCVIHRPEVHEEQMR